MALANLRTTDAAKTAKGSPYMIIAEVATSSPYALVSPVVWYKAPLITDSNRAGESADENLELEDGSNILLTSEETFTLNTTFGQQDLLTKKWIEQEAKGKIFCFIKEEHTVSIKDATGAEQYHYGIYPNVTRSGSITRNAKSAETEVQWTVKKLEALATLTDIPNAATSGFKATLPTTIAVAAGLSYDLVGVDLA